MEPYIKNLEDKLKIYLKEISENITFSVLPVLRWQYPNGECQIRTISSSIKISRFSSCSLLAKSCSLLAKRILISLKKALLVYELSGLDINLYLLGRPWLNTNEFALTESEITQLFDEQIEKEIQGVILFWKSN
jgi:hypothetical protein